MKKTDFSSGNVCQSIWSMALPMIVAQVINLLYNIVDRIYIGRIPVVGRTALTGLGLCFPILTAITAFSRLFGTGGAPLASAAQGRKDDEEAERIMCNTFVMLVGVGVVLTVVGFLVERPVLHLFGASGNTYPYAHEYLTVYLIGTVSVMIVLGMNGFINAQGYGRMGMITVALGAALNIVLDPLFIFVFDMGVRGAALATILSQTVSALWVLRFLTGKKATLRLQKKSMKLSFQRIRRITELGFCGFIMAVTNSAVSVACNTMLAAYGGDLYVGVMTVVSTLREVLLMPVNGLTNGATPVLAYNYGAKAYDRVKKGIIFTTASCTVYTLAAWFCTVRFTETLIRIFNSDPDLIAAGVPSIHLYFFGFFMMALQISGQTVFVALGKSRQAIFFSLLRKAIIVVPLTLWLPGMWGLGVKGVFLAEPISNFAGGIACYSTMLLLVFPELSGKKKKTAPESAAAGV